MNIQLEGYVSHPHPCRSCSNEYPRGGVILFYKKELDNFVRGINSNYGDAIVLYLNNKITLCGIYIPPNDSEYLKDQFEFLDSITRNAHENNEKLMIFGDLNSRIGKVDSLNGFQFSENCDNTINQNGRKLLEFMKAHKMIPLNNLNAENHKYKGNFTFYRGDSKSQIDWFLADEFSLNLVNDFEIINMTENTSDLPVSICVDVDLFKPIGKILESIIDLCAIRNNHSKQKRIKDSDIDKTAYERIATCLISNNKWNTNAEECIEGIENVIVNAAKSSKITKTTNDTKNGDWCTLMNDKNSKRLWGKIDWQGNLYNEPPKSENNINDYATFLKDRCSLPNEHTNFDDLKSSVYNPITDSRIGEKELHDSVKYMQSKGQANIPICLIMIILPQIINIFTSALNSVFLGEYPRDWNPIMKCLPKKGKLNIPCFRGIGIKNVFAKIYDTILRRRLEKFIHTPEEQTAYQKTKGCFMHVFFVRAVIAIVKKRNIPFYIGVTDFACAFDGISRKILFQKLIKMGIGMFMLNALLQVYSNTWTFIEMSGEYSKEFQTTSGVIQGSATSTILFMAYTSDIIKLFQDTFSSEDIINLYHLLLHADDALILATSKYTLIKKFKFMESYCKSNCIKLEPSKCKFICINSNEHDEIVLESGNIESKSEANYLGSIINNKGNINKDITTEICMKQKAFNKYYAFLRVNYNAPLEVKLRVLHACVYSAIIYNCETWGNANLAKLEKQYCNILKYTLGVGKKVCNEFIYIELGLPTLKSIILRRQWKFYKNIISEKDWPMLRYIVNQSRIYKSNFISHYDNLITSFQSADEITDKSITEMKSNIRDKASEGRTKYCTYLDINPSLSKPEVYRHNVPTYKLQQLSKFRLGNHRLKIETGRHFPSKPREERLCICGEVEDEFHFLTGCYLYTHVREEYKQKIDYINISRILDNTHSADYIHHINEVRKLFM